MAREVLITEGGNGASRAALAAVRSLGRAGYSPVVTVSDPRMSYAGRSRYASRLISAPQIAEDREGYLGRVEEEIARSDFLVTLPASDPALLGLRPEMLTYVDKSSMTKRAAKVGMSTPPTLQINGADLAEAGQSVAYPAIIKPTLKVVGARLIESPRQLLSFPDDPSVTWLVQPYLQDEMRGLVGLMWKGKLVAATHLRYRNLWPLPVGTVASGFTAEPDYGLEERVEVLLGDYDGLFHIDLAGDHLLDLNPRVHAALPVAAAAGTDLVVQYCSALEGRSGPVTRGRSGILFRWLEADIRSTVSGFRGGRLSGRETLNRLAPRRGTIHSVWAWGDMRPVLARFRQVGARLSRSEVGSQS